MNWLYTLIFLLFAFVTSIAFGFIISSLYWAIPAKIYGAPVEEWQAFDVRMGQAMLTLVVGFFATWVAWVAKNI